MAGVLGASRERPQLHTAVLKPHKVLPHPFAPLSSSLKWKQSHSCEGESNLQSSQSSIRDHECHSPRLSENGASTGLCSLGSILFKTALSFQRQSFSKAAQRTWVLQKKKGGNGAGSCPSCCKKSGFLHSERGGAMCDFNIKKVLMCNET